MDATLAHLRARSAPSSRLIVVYLAPGRLVFRIAALLVRRLGEPFRSTFKPEALRALLAQHGFCVACDEDVQTAARRLAPTVEDGASRVKYMRLAVTDLP